MIASSFLLKFQFCIRPRAVAACGLIALTLCSTDCAIAAPPPTESPCDFDKDGKVDVHDLATWSFDFGVGNLGDGDFDGDTDGADFLCWQREFNPNGGLSTIHTVPEPSAFALAMFLGAAGLLARRRDWSATTERG